MERAKPLAEVFPKLAAAMREVREHRARAAAEAIAAPAPAQVEVNKVGKQKASA